jgi:hypothetical protein
MKRPPAIRSACGAAVCLVATAGLAVSGGPGKETIHLTRSGQVAARAATLAQSDLSGSGWIGGRKAPDAGPDAPCPHFQPLQRDLTVNGKSETVYNRGSVNIRSEATVYATAAMVRHDWQRSMRPPFAPCLRMTLVNALPSGSRVISVIDPPFPRLAPYVRRYRFALFIRGAGGLTRFAADFLFIAHGRTELDLAVLSPPNPSLETTEVRLARAVVSRITA